MDWKRIGKALLFPHPVLMALLLPVATVLLVFSMVFLGTESPVSYASYVLAAYTMTVWCVRIPNLIRFFRRFRANNKYAIRWAKDDRWRMNVTLYGTLMWNTAYAVMQLGLGFIHRTFWFYSLGGYYILLAIMRFFLARHTSHYHRGEKMRVELHKYRACGWIFLLMNLYLALIVFFMVYWNRTFHHHEITTITLAAFTFTSFTLAVIGLVKYRKYNSPVYSASKIISLTSACVSMLTLTSTMLTTFADGNMDAMQSKLLLGAVGGAVVVFVTVMAVYMIRRGSRDLKQLASDSGKRKDEN